MAHHLFGPSLVKLFSLVTPSDFHLFPNKYRFKVNLLDLRKVIIHIINPYINSTMIILTVHLVHVITSSGQYASTILKNTCVSSPS
jgi:hypothetical protein